MAEAHPDSGRVFTRGRAGRQVLFTVRSEGLTATANWLAARAAAWQTQIFPLTRRKIPYCEECRLFGTAIDVGHWTRDTDNPRG